MLIALSVYYSCVLYLAGKDKMPVTVNSHYETGYLTIGRASIYMIFTINLIGGFGLMMIYFIVFGDTTASIVHMLFYPNTSNFLTTRACYVIVLGLCLVYPVCKKQLGEIKILSILLFICIGLFFVLMLTQLFTLNGLYNADKSFE